MAKSKKASFQPNFWWIIGIALVIALIIAGSHTQINQLFKASAPQSTPSLPGGVFVPDPSQTASQVPVACVRAEIQWSGSTNSSASGLQNVQTTYSINNQNVKVTATCVQVCGCNTYLKPGTDQCPSGTIKTGGPTTCNPSLVVYQSSDNRPVSTIVPQIIEPAAEAGLEKQCNQMQAQICNSACSNSPMAADTAIMNAKTKPQAQLTCQPGKWIYPTPNPISPPTQTPPAIRCTLPNGKPCPTATPTPVPAGYGTYCGGVYGQTCGTGLTCQYVPNQSNYFCMPPAATPIGF